MHCVYAACCTAACVLVGVRVYGYTHRCESIHFNNHGKRCWQFFIICKLCILHFIVKLWQGCMHQAQLQFKTQLRIRRHTQMRTGRQGEWHD